MKIDPVAVATYHRIVFANPPRATTIALRGLPETGQRGAPHLVWGDTIVEFVETCCRRGLAAYCIPGFVTAPGRAGAADVVSLPFLVIDLDSGDIEDKVSRAVESLGPATLVVRSGGVGKRHLYWRLRGDTAPDRVSRLRGYAAKMLGGDESFARPHQPIRIAGSIHRKGAPTPVEIESVNEAATTTIEAAFGKLSRLAGPATAAGGNGLGLARTVSLDELPTMHVGHGDLRINRFEAMTRMMGMLIANIHDIQNASEIALELALFRKWASTHVDNLERDYDVHRHWSQLVAREAAKRRSPSTFRVRPALRQRNL